VVEKAKAKKNGVIVVTVTADEPGTFNALATVEVRGRKFKAARLITYGTATATTGSAGPVKLSIAPTASGRKALRSNKSIPVAVHLSFRSSARLGTTSTSKDLRIKVKGKKKH
jgi:hypothetical protein